MVWDWLSTARRRGTEHQFLDRSLPGALTVLFILIHIFVFFRTTCRAALFMAPQNCGLPGMVVPWFFAKLVGQRAFHRKDSRPFHFRPGLPFLLDRNLCFQPWLLPLAVAWFLVLFISLGPKRYHGLLHRLPKS